MPRIRSLSLLLLAVVLTYCGGGGGYSSSPTDPGSGGSSGQVRVVQVLDDRYDPMDITISPGDTVRWVMMGVTYTHTVTARDNSFDSGAVFTTQGAVYERRFDTRGTYDYACRVHGACCGMRGSVRVGADSPNPSPGY